MKPLKVYIAGPYTNDNPEVRKANIKKAQKIGQQFLEKGHHPYVPHTHTGYWKDLDVTYEDVMQFHFTFLDNWAEALFFIDSSPGADREKIKAEQLGIPVFTSMEEFDAFASKNL